MVEVWVVTKVKRSYDCEYVEILFASPTLEDAQMHVRDLHPRMKKQIKWHQEFGIWVSTEVDEEIGLCDWKD